MLENRPKLSHLMSLISLLHYHLEKRRRSDIRSVWCLWTWRYFYVKKRQDSLRLSQIIAHYLAKLWLIRQTKMMNHLAFSLVLISHNRSNAILHTSPFCVWWWSHTTLSIFEWPSRNPFSRQTLKLEPAEFRLCQF